MAVSLSANRGQAMRVYFRIVDPESPELVERKIIGRVASGNYIVIASAGEKGSFPARVMVLPPSAQVPQAICLQGRDVCLVPECISVSEGKDVTRRVVFEEGSGFGLSEKERQCLQRCDARAFQLLRELRIAAFAPGAGPLERARWYEATGLVRQAVEESITQQVTQELCLT